jgi:protein-S-isoprenylcysteine O-methyltransferase Ste14
MAGLNKKAFAGLAQLFIAMTALIFLPAWTIVYWQAWTFLAAFFLPVIAITLYLAKYDPALLARRVVAGPGAEKEKSQKIVQSVASLAFVAIFVIAALDHRFTWSFMPWTVVIAGEVLVALGLFVVFLVFKENSFTSATIEIGADQKVISTGPYAVVRHPMYAGAFIMLIGVSLGLGSLWALIPVFILAAAIIWRLLEEERFLVKNLTGYAEYRRKVRYRLLPFVW